MIQIAIVEDEDRFAARLEEYLSQYMGHTKEEYFVCKFCDGYDIVEKYPADLDIIFMDIEMAFMDGMEAAEKIREMDKRVVIIFVTNMAQYAIRGYKVNALDYILKPISYADFSQSLDRAIRTLEKNKDVFITVKYKEGIVKIKSREILWIESQGHRLIFHTNQINYETTVYSMKEVEQRLESEGFKRCNNGSLVNLRMVQGICGGFVEVGGTSLQISRGKKNEFMSSLVRYMTE